MNFPSCYAHETWIFRIRRSFYVKWLFKIWNYSSGKNFPKTSLILPRISREPYLCPWRTNLLGLSYLKGELLFLMLFVREFLNLALGESADFAAKIAGPLNRRIARRLEICISIDFIHWTNYFVTSKAKTYIFSF